MCIYPSPFILMSLLIQVTGVYQTTFYPLSVPCCRVWWQKKHKFEPRAFNPFSALSTRSSFALLCVLSKLWKWCHWAQCKLFFIMSHKPLRWYPVSAFRANLVKCYESTGPGCYVPTVSSSSNMHFSQEVSFLYQKNYSNATKTWLHLPLLHGEMGQSVARSNPCLFCSHLSASS